MSILFTRLSRINFYIPSVLLCLLFPLLLWQAAVINQQKVFWTNRDQLRQYTEMRQLIPNDWEVYDTEGRMIAWKQPYYICCLSFGEWIGNISRPPLPLRDTLETRKVPYLFQGDSRRIYTLPMEDRVYIQSHYVMVSGWGDTLWRRL
jgi:hypothetical protein